MEENMGKQKVTVEGAVELSEAVAYLEKIVTALKAGQVHLQQGLKEVDLVPPSIVDLKIEAKKKDDSERISIKIGWSGDPKYGMQSGVSISPGTPPMDIA